MTRKVKGKTITETFATPAELHKAQREVEAYHRFRQLAQELLEINERICRARPVEQGLTPAKKKTAEIIQQEVAREVEHLLGLVLRAGVTAGPVDLEAVEMAVRCSMHQAGSGGAEPTAPVRPSQFRNSGNSPASAGTAPAMWSCARNRC